jgi:hypothetical protein
VHHVGTFSQLEDQLTSFTSDFDRGSAGYSPDRLDALVWSLTELMPVKKEQDLFFAPPFVVTAPRYWPGDSSPSQRPGGEPSAENAARRNKVLQSTFPEGKP